jgi:Lysylphosphatidylglycerol synthase TM region
VIARPGWRVGLGAPAYLLCDIAMLWLTIHALGYNTPPAPLIVAYLLGYLANALPVTGGIGVLDGGLAGALVAYHVPAATAFGGVLVYHALALWIPTASGTLAFIAAQRDIAIGERRRTRPPGFPAAGHGQPAFRARCNLTPNDRRAWLDRAAATSQLRALRRSTFEGKPQVD